jgi:hypothetical protein
VLLIVLCASGFVGYREVSLKREVGVNSEGGGASKKDNKQTAHPEVKQQQPAPNQTSPTEMNQSTQSSTTMPVYVPNPCTDLIKRETTVHSEYIKQLLDDIDLIYQEIRDRYNVDTDSYPDLGTVRSAVTYANTLLNKKYAELSDAHSAMENAGCSYNDPIYQYQLPSVSEYPSTWSNDAYHMIIN